MKTKGMMFWAAMAGMAVCVTLAYGPTAGIGAFFLLAIAILTLA